MFNRPTRVTAVSLAIRSLEPTDLDEATGIDLAVAIMQKVGILDEHRLRQVLANEIYHEPMPG